jgi:perosamine synthetase
VSSKLALEGGAPVRPAMLPYAKQTIDEDDRNAVEQILRSDWLTTGPAVPAFESGLCRYTGAEHAVAVNSGTAALHAAMFVLGVAPGDEVIVPAISFVATANCVRYQGATPVFADVSRDTFNIDPADAERRVTPKTKAIISVDFAGHPCDQDSLRDLGTRHNLALVSDAAHSLGATYRGQKVGTLQDLTALSFHPVKHITTGEGGALLTADPTLAKKARSFRHHGIDVDLHTRNATHSWAYDTTVLGFNYRISDFSCALGSSQLDKLDGWLSRRREIAKLYNDGLANIGMLELPIERSDCKTAWHLYVVRLKPETITASRAEIFSALRAENIGVNVHYIPIPWMSYYAGLGYRRGGWPVAESEYERIISIPMYPRMSDDDVADVVSAFQKIWTRFRR